MKIGTYNLNPIAWNDKLKTVNHEIKQLAKHIENNLHQHTTLYLYKTKIYHPMINHSTDDLMIGEFERGYLITLIHENNCMIDFNEYVNVYKKDGSNLYTKEIHLSSNETVYIEKSGSMS